MNFSDQLHAYMKALSCSARDICDASGISAASFSRYKNGERIPELGTKAFDGLCDAIAGIAAQKSMTDITSDSVRESFLA